MNHHPDMAGDSSDAESGDAESGDAESSDADPFDEKAATWDDDPAHVERAELVAERIAATVHLEPAVTRLLEYGAGTGLVSENLITRVGSVTLADTSEGMRRVMDAKVATGRLGAARIVSLDLSTDQIPDDRFDLIVTVLTLHHVDDLSRVLEAFATMIDPGGYLCVVDLDAEDGSFHGEGFGGHHGFDRGEIAEMLKRVGFEDIEVSDCHHIERDNGRFTMFLAVGRR